MATADELDLQRLRNILDQQREQHRRELIDKAATNIRNARRDMRIGVQSGQYHRCHHKRCLPLNELDCIKRGLLPPNAPVYNTDVYVCKVGIIHQCTRFTCEYRGVCPVTAIERTVTYTDVPESTGDEVEEEHELWEKKVAKSKETKRIKTLEQKLYQQSKTFEVYSLTSKTRGLYNKLPVNPVSVTKDILPVTFFTRKRSRRLQQKAEQEKKEEEKVQEVTVNLPQAKRPTVVRHTRTTQLRAKLRTNVYKNIEETLTILLFDKGLRNAANLHICDQYEEKYKKRWSELCLKYKKLRRWPNTQTMRSEISTKLSAPCLYSSLSPLPERDRYARRLHVRNGLSLYGVSNSLTQRK